MIRVFVSQTALSDGRLHLDGADARHVGGALRVRPGEKLVAVTPDGVEHRCVVREANAQRVDAEVVASQLSRAEPKTRLRLGLALLKGDQFDRILEYAGEVGVESVQPLLTERAVAKLEPDRAEKRMERWRQILRQGAELGQRGRVPELLEPAGIEAAVAAARNSGRATFLLYEGSGLPSLSTVQFDTAAGAAILVGPEGGWSQAEVMLAEQIGAIAVTLGPRIMRPLPAALTAVAVLLHRAGELELPEKEE